MNRAWYRLKQFVKTTSFRLASTYLGIIMLMSISFSFVFFNTSSHELGRQLPPHVMGTGGNVDGPNDPAANPLFNQPSAVNNFLQQRVSEGRHALLIRLVLLNALALVGGSELSYLLARRTLRPIEAAIDAQIQFVSDASHELRTPLTVIQTTNDVTLRDKNLSLKQAKVVIANNIQEVIKLKTLSDGLLNLAKQDNASLVTSAQDLQIVASEAVNRIIVAAQHKAISLQDDVPKLEVIAHREALIEILFILLDNAVKYSSRQATIFLTAQRRGHAVYITVRDTGIGMDAADLPHIFGRFYRADSARSHDQASNGYGLGLAMAHKLVQQQHGELSVASELGKGTSFRVKLPAA